MCPVGWAGHAHEQCFQCECLFIGFVPACVLEIKCNYMPHFTLQMSARKMTTALLTRPVSQRSVLIPVREPLAEIRLCAQLSSTGPSAVAHQGCRVILWCAVSLLAVSKMRTVIPGRNVTMAPRDAFPSAPLELVLKEPSVMHATIGSSVPVFPLSREMATAFVKDVRTSWTEGQLHVVFVINLYLSLPSNHCPRS